MIGLLLIAALISQGIPLPASETGTVTGTLKTELGTPAVGVRVGAMAKPESASDAVAGTALASIAETDAAGHFRLENIPPGRYYITAGRVDFPTFFPGTQLMTAGTAIPVKPGETVPGIDFVLNPVAVRPPDSGLGITATPTLNLPINIIVNTGGKVPIYSAQGFASLQLTRTSDGTVSVFPLASVVSMAIPTVAAATPEYRIALHNLPEGYRVGSMQYGTTPITNATVRINSTAATTTAMARVPSNISPTASVPIGPPLSITLVAPLPGTAEPGVRVTGSAPTAEPRSVYLSGVPGIFYADGSFEFRNVKPGRYSIATPDNPLSSRPLAASVVVGDQDLVGVELVATPLLPKDIQTQTPPKPVGAHSPGFTIPQGVIQGQVLEDATHDPIPEGTAYLTGHYGGSRSLVPDGRFEFTRLLPGSYDLEVQIFGHDTIRRTIIIDDEDVTLDLSAAPIH